MSKILKKLSPGRIVALGFAVLILLGSLVLMLPVSLKEGVSISYIDALYTSTSAVCVTGLVCVDTADTFSPFGQCVIALLIQVGGLGVAAVGAGVMLVVRHKINLRDRYMLRESLNRDSGAGVVQFLKNIFKVTLLFELTGAAASFIVFVQDYPPLRAAGISLFHSIAAFNNAGFDILGSFQSLSGYTENAAINLITCWLVFWGGIGFWVILELWRKKFSWKKLSMHAKVVLSVSLFLIVATTLLLKLTEEISWLGAFFCAVSVRTAGFSTYSLSEFTGAGLIVVIIMMFIGASPGSTGGGTKTSTWFVLFQGLKSAATNTGERAFHYSIPKESFRKAATIVLLGMSVVLAGTWLMLFLEPQLNAIDALFEVVSAYGTVGLSTGVTQMIGFGGKVLTIIIMYIGRLGVLTVVSLWYFVKVDRVRYPEGNIAIG